MNLSWLVRARWRLVGAWMWPAFVVFAVADGLIGHVLPLTGDSQSVLGGIILGLICNLVVVAVLAWPLAMALRRWRRDLPLAIARDYAGAAGVVAVTLLLVAVGLLNRPSISDDHATFRDAAERAAAWIGDHAPAQFRADAADLTAVMIQRDTVYRECAANRAGTRDYCVVVDESRPLSRSVIPAGSEPNSSLDRELN